MLLSCGVGEDSWESLGLLDEMVGWHHLFNGHELGKLWEMMRDRKTWCAAVHRVTVLDTTWQLINNSKGLEYNYCLVFF